MKTAASVLLLAALVALMVMSFAPADLVRLRSGLGSIAGVVTAIALLAFTAVGGWLWYREKRHKND